MLSFVSYLGHGNQKLRQLVTLNILSCFYWCGYVKFAELSACFTSPLLRHCAQQIGHETSFMCNTKEMDENNVQHTQGDSGFQP